MKARLLFFLILPMLMIACSSGGSVQVPLAEIPDPAIYGLSGSELPDVGLPWMQTYQQTITEPGYKWAYQAFQAYQPGNLGIELESGFAINNDVVLYEADVSRDDLPQPPDSLGDIQDISWKSVPQTHPLGDKSAVWKTTIGDMHTPAWWLAFYQGHAYVRLAMIGFPDQIAPAILYGLGDILSSRLPGSVEQLRADIATQVATQPPMRPTFTPMASPSSEFPTPSPEVTAAPTQVTLNPSSYTAPPGETGMVDFIDDTGNQLTDGLEGMDDILADQGNGTAYEWVGWTDLTEPVTLTFSFDGEVSIGSIEIGINHREGLGIFVPAKVTINGVDFEIDAEAIPNNQREDLVFQGPFGGPEVQMVLHHRGRGWLLVDEVRFFSGE